MFVVVRGRGGGQYQVFVKGKRGGHSPGADLRRIGDVEISRFAQNVTTVRGQHAVAAHKG